MIDVRQPMLGLFWFVGPIEQAELVGLSRDEGDVPTIGGFRTLVEGHVDIWRGIVRTRPELASYEYEFFPRGRVNWSSDDDRYILLADRKILDAGLHLQVVAEWHLPPDRVEVLSDPHYRCHSLTTAFPEGFR